MMIGQSRFNIYLLVASLALVVGACRSSKPERKEDMLSSLRVNIEVNGAPTDFSTRVPVFRREPVMITIDTDPFLTEANVASAKVVDTVGGFSLQIEFDHEGALLLENYTTANPGRRMAIFSTFGKQKDQSRWLAAPMINRRITNGILLFTPDASREEAERIALGLNNVAKKNEKKNKW